MPTRPFSPALHPTFTLTALAAGFVASGCFAQPTPTPTPTPSPTPSPTPAPAPSPDTPAAAPVQPCLEAMAKAVLDADPDAYLRRIAPRSAFFLVEQKEWAKDLAKPETRPIAFTATAAAPGSRSTASLRLVAPDGTLASARDVEVWTGSVRFAWTMPSAGPAKLKSPSTAVEFDARFYLVEGAWLFAGEALEVLETPTAVIHYPKGAETPAKLIAEAFPAAKKHDDAFFGSPIDRVEEIRLYDRRDVLQFSVYPSMFQTDTTLSGWSEPGQSIKFMTSYARDARGWTAAFAHEYGHVATWAMGDKAANMPWWVQEGVAELAAETFTGGRARIDRILTRWAKDGDLPDWPAISDYRSTDQKLRLHPYHQGHHMVGFVSDAFGDAKRNDWLRAMAAGSDVERSTDKVLGLSFTELDRRWRDHVRALVDKAAEPKDAPKAEPK